MKYLTSQHKKFITEYIKTVNGELSAELAGYKNNNLKETAQRLLSEKIVIKEIKSRLKEQIISLQVEKAYVIQKLLQIAEFSLEEEDILDKEGCTNGKKKLRDTSTGLKALESLCKYLGLNNSSEIEAEKPVKIITISNLDENKI